MERKARRGRRADVDSFGFGAFRSMLFAIVQVLGVEQSEAICGIGGPWFMACPHERKVRTRLWKHHAIPVNRRMR